MYQEDNHRTLPLMKGGDPPFFAQHGIRRKINIAEGNNNEVKHYFDKIWRFKFRQNLYFEQSVLAEKSSSSCTRGKRFERRIANQMDSGSWLNM